MLVGPRRSLASLRVDYEPQLTALVDTPPAGDEWLHEIKYDGYRIGCLIENGRVRLLTRNGQNYTAALPEVVAAAKTLGVSDALLDGEVVVLRPDGRASFTMLQQALSGTGPARLAGLHRVRPAAPRGRLAGDAAARGAQGEAAEPARQQHVVALALRRACGRQRARLLCRGRADGP